MLINSFTVLTYFLAGVAKLAGPYGIKWVLGESVRAQVSVDAIRKALLSTGAQPLAFFLYNKLYIFTAIGVSTIIIEIGAPLAIVKRKIGYLWSFLAFAMHWGIYFIMGITFDYQMAGIIFLPFFELEKVPSYIKNFFAVHFKIDYQNSSGDLSNYYPDFIVKRNEKEIYIIETKGRENGTISVPIWHTGCKAYSS